MQHRNASRPHWASRGRLVVCALILVLIVPTGVSAQTSGELQRELGEATQDRDQLASELDGVRERLQMAEIELAQIGARLEDARLSLTHAEGQVALAEEALEEAREEQDRADRRHREAEDLLADAEDELAAEEDTLTEHLVHTFKYGTVGATAGSMALEVLRRAEDPNAFAVGMKQIQMVVDDQDAVVKRVFELREQRAERADDLARARSQALQAANDAAQTLRVVQELREEAEILAAEVADEEEQQRVLLASLEISEAETASLLERAAVRQRDLERDLARQIAREQAAVAAAAAAAPGSGTGRLALPGADGGPPLEGILCPVVGAVAGRDFSNDWGYPRSGGRTHRGNDIFASRGTPVVAIADGEVTGWNPPSSPTRLGGITVTYRTSDGSEWYNAHLDTIAEGVTPGATVSRGQVIGTVGNTGNAATTPAHLHIGRRYGGAAVNPWPTISPFC